MKRRLISVVMFAIVAAAVSSTILYKVISGNSKPAVAPATRTVQVAARDLEAGSLLTDADVRSAEWPASDNAAWLSKRGDVVGRVLLTPVGKDEPLAESRLAPKGAAPGMASRIPSGMRAVAVRVDELSGLSRLILPGMHVDVISTGAAAGAGAPGLVARTILQNVEVFSTGQGAEHELKERAASSGVFNLLVTPQQAEVLSQAVAQTRIELVLRNPLDKENFFSESMAKPSPVPAPVRRVAEPEVKAPEPAKPPAPVAPPPPPAPAVFTVEVIHGSKRTETPVATVTGPGR